MTARALFAYYDHLNRTGEHGLDNAEMVKVRADVERAIGLETLYKLEQATLGDIKMFK